MVEVETHTPIRVQGVAGILTPNKHNLKEEDLMAVEEETDLEAVGVKRGNKVDRADLLCLRILLGLGVGMIMVVEGDMIGRLLKGFQMDQDLDGKDKAKDYLVVRDRDGSRFKTLLRFV